jgi:D-serine deaminase-like pyridoxal phosphate-dependent protein
VLDTPYLAVDLDVLDRNLDRTAAAVRAKGLALRPHAKTHKCPEIARRQLDRGAVGLTVATVGEAEVFADAGVTDLFIAYPLWPVGPRAARLRALAERVALRVGVDSADAVDVLAPVLGGTAAEVVVEVDSGQHRSGVPAEQAAAVAAAAERAGLRVAGAFTFPGHGYGPGRAAGATADEAAALGAVEIDGPVRSGGSTPTVALADPAALTEVRPGVYVFNDAQQAELGTCELADVALTAVGTVVSATGQQVVLDAGSKVLGADQPAWVSGGGRLPDHPDARVVALSEHHATVLFPDGAPPPLRRGDVVRVAPNHVCAAVNLADELVVVRGGDVVDRWEVAARGANT